MENLFEPYQTYQTLDIVLEVLAVLLAIVSVLYSKNNNIKVYPTGIISTTVFIYLLYKWQLYGDLLINIYYFVMSIYGWYLWSHPTEEGNELKISRTQKRDLWISLMIFVSSTVFVWLVYLGFDRFGVWWSYVDILTTGLFFMGMYLLAKRKVEHWLVLAVGDLISIPLYYYKGYTLTGILYLVYTFIAVVGYFEWKKIWNKEYQTL